MPVTRKPTMLNKSLKSLLIKTPLLVVVMALATGCGSDDNSPQNLKAGDVTTAVEQVVNFKAMLGDEPYICGQTYSNIGTQMSDFTAKDFRLYASNITTTLSDGTKQIFDVMEDGVWQHDGVVLLDFGHSCDLTTDQPINTQITGSVKLMPGQIVHQLCFDVGVPFEANHEDNTLQASPLNVSGMYWAWQSGHKFFRLDGVTDAGGFNVHLGSTGCVSEGRTQAPISQCANPNRPTICLDLDLTTQSIIVDAKALLADADVSQNTANTAPGCMSGNNDPECQTIIPKFGLDFTYTPSASEQTLQPKQAQSVFYVQ